MPPSAQTNKLTSTLRLLIPRLRLLQKKDTASSVIQRRELAHLLSEDRLASARIRVENVIQTDVAVEVMEIVELYCELLLARANVLDQIAFGEGGARIRARGKEGLKRVNNAPAGQGGGRPSSTAEEKGAGGGAGIGFPFRGLGRGRKQESHRHPETTSTPQGQVQDEEGDEDEEESYINPPLDEAALSIFYAWSRFPHDIRELTILRTLLAERWGKEFMALAQDNKVEGARVPERLVKGLRVRAPSRELVESYLREIARAYGVSYPEGDGEGPGKPPGEPSGEFGGGGDGDMGGDGGEGGGGDGDIQNPPAPSASGHLDTPRRPSDPADLSAYSPPRGLHAGRSPVSVAPPAARTDNPRPRVKLPDAGPETGTGAAENEVAPSASGTGGSGGIPEVDELSRRFAALRR